MPLVLKDRVKETCSSPGTGTVTLLGASTGYQSFAAIGDGNTTFYVIADQGGPNWEVGIGTYTASGTTLSRDTVLASSAGGTTKANFSTGSQEVFVTYPSEKSVNQDAAGDVNITDAIITNATISTATLTSGTISTQPANPLDIANKTYVDTLAGEGLSIHTPVYVESPSTTGNLTATYTNGGTTPTWTDITNNKELATASAHSLSVNDVIVFGSTTNGITAGTAYFVKSTPTSTSITLSLAYNGAEITSLTNGTGLTITSLANSGVGATLTNAGTQAALVIDGKTLTTSQRVLIYNQTNAFENGVYTVTDVGSGSTNWVLTRATDANKYAPNSVTSLGKGDYFYVEAGDTGAGESYVLTAPSGIIIFGTTNLTFTQFSSSQIYSAGTGLDLVNNVFSLEANYGDTLNPYASKTANYVLASPNGSPGQPTFRALVAADVPTLNQNTTGTAANVTGVVAIANGGTGATTDSAARTALGLGSIATQAANNVAITGGTIETTKLQAYTETVSTIGVVSGLTQNLDLSTANIFDVTLGNNVTFTFTNPPASGILKSATIILRQDGTGNKTATFTNANYTEGNLPVLSTGANEIDVLTFFTVNGGSFWFGTFAMANVS